MKILVIIMLLFIGIIPFSYSQTEIYTDLLEKKQDKLWNLGKNLAVGDSYTYKICDPDAIVHYSAESYHYFTKNMEHNSSLCYTVNLEFVNLIFTDQNQISGNIWIVQAAIRDDYTNETRHLIFHVDSDSFEVRSADTIHPDTIRYAQSLQNTIFSIYKYTAQESKLLQSGIIWGEVTEYHDIGRNPDMKVIDGQKWNVSSYYLEPLQQKIIPEQKELDVFSVGYEVDIIDGFDGAVEDTNNVTNYYIVNSNLPFPVSGEHYNPSYIIEPHKEYEFKLLSYLETNSSKLLSEPVPNVIVNPNLPITQTGTIQLTFPDDTIPDDVEVIPDDVEVIPDDVEIIQDDVEIIQDDVEIIQDDITTNNGDIISLNNSETKQNDSTLFVVAMLAIVLCVAGLVIWKKLSFQWKNKKQNITKTKITFTDKINLEIKTMPQPAFKQDEIVW